MKRATSYINIAFIFCFLSSYSQERIIQLNLEEGYNYVFKHKTTYSEYDNSGKQFVESVYEKEIKFYIEEVNNDRVVFTSVVISGKSENPDAEIKTIHNIQFPPHYENIDLYRTQSNIIRSLLCMVELKFEIDLIHDTIRQINSTEMLEEMDSILTEKGYNKIAINRVTEFIQNNDEVFRQIIAYNNLLLYTNHAEVNEHEELISKYLNKRLSRDKNGLYTSGQNVQLPEKQYIRLSVDETHGFISEFFEVKYDTIKSRFSTSNRSLTSAETKFSFIDKYKQGNDLFTFNCTIQNPTDSVITLFYLDNPYGEVHTSRYLKLDSNNTVTTQIYLPAQSFIFLSLEETKYNRNYAGYILYADPRDTLTVNVLRENKSTRLVFSGNNEVINNVIYRLAKDKYLFSPVDKMVQTARTASNQIVYGFREEAVKILDNYLQDKSITLNNNAYRFLSRELKAMQFLNYFSFLNSSSLIRINTDDKREKGEDEVNKDNSRLVEAKQMIQGFDIHDIYNDYGIFSRQLSDQYLYYYLNNLTRVKIMGYNQRGTVSDEYETAKMIVGGAIYYRIMAERIIGSIMKKTVISSPRSSLVLQEEVTLLNSLKNFSYEKYFNSTIQEFIETRMNWEAESYIPDIQFIRSDGSKIQMDNLIGDKPVIMYVSNNWSRFRYNFDKMAEENPDIRFVMIMEGNNLKEWQDYLQRAEPVAEQLLLIDDELTLEDIFSHSDGLFIAYDKNGNILGYDVGGKKAINLIKESLSGKKELNKSQLQIIVLFLVVALLALAAGFLIWKWRVRQRFKNEQQQRRLRELELTAIRSQMNPHFLFNCLNSVQNLVQQNKGREAHLYLADFAGLIRKVLNNSEKEEVSLAEELEMIKQYLNLEKLRFDFDYRIDVDERVDIHNTLVPSMLLQPFAENAVIHGLQNKKGKKNLIIDVKYNRAAEGNSKEITISIEDNGVGRTAAQKLAAGSNGKGTILVKERLKILQQQQKERYGLQITDLNGNGATGTRVEIFVPEEN